MEKEYYITKEQFIALKEAWNQKQSHSASEMIIYNILRSKPADNGFCQKTKNIQGCDEWYAFNQARYAAENFCSPDHIMVEDPTAPLNRITGRPGKKWIFDIEPALKRFKAKYGLDMPEDIESKIKESKK